MEPPEEWLNGQACTSSVEQIGDNLGASQMSHEEEIWDGW